MTIKQRLLALLRKAKMDSLALEVYHGTLLSNRNARSRQNIRLPPSSLMKRVAGTTDAHRFIWSGRLTVARILDLIQLEGAELSRGKALLDFGCGCGRLTRYLSTLLDKHRVYGTDTDIENVEWCRTNLSDGSFFVNGQSPPLPFSEGQFDSVISYSVFTHICVADQPAWLKELGRVTSRGGLLVFSTHGYEDIYQYPELAETDELARYRRGEIVAVGADMGYAAQSNYGVYHPRGTVERLAAEVGCFRHCRTVNALRAPPMDSAGHNLHLWRRL